MSWRLADRGDRTASSSPQPAIDFSLGAGSVQSPLNSPSNSMEPLVHYCRSGPGPLSLLISMINLCWENTRLPCILPLINKLRYIINLSAKRRLLCIISTAGGLSAPLPLTAFLKSNSFICFVFFRIPLAPFFLPSCSRVFQFCGRLIKLYYLYVPFYYRWG